MGNGVERLSNGTLVKLVGIMILAMVGGAGGIQFLPVDQPAAMSSQPSEDRVKRLEADAADHEQRLRSIERTLGEMNGHLVYIRRTMDAETESTDAG